MKFNLYQNGRKAILPHVMKMESVLGRRLRPNEVVHHRNGNKLDNQIGNLEIRTRGSHSSTHNKVFAKRRRRIKGRFA